MRLDLQTHPKVVRILSATKADKFRVIGGLHAVWSVFDTHSSDGTLPGYAPETLDHIIGWDGFSSAMISVGWLVLEGAETLILPEFDEHNGKSGKRRAEDQKRKREERKNPQSVRTESGQVADKKRTREEKRREDKDTAPAAPLFELVQSKTSDADDLLFPNVAQQVVEDFKTLRKQKKAAITKTAMDLIASQAKLAGLSLEDALRVCCSRGWSGFKAEWVLRDGAQPAPTGPADWLKGAI